MTSNKIMLTTDDDFNNMKLTEDKLNGKHVLVYVKRSSCPYCSMMQGNWDKLCSIVKNESKLLVVEIDKTVYKPEKTPQSIRDLMGATHFVPNVVMTEALHKKGPNVFRDFVKERTVNNLVDFVNTTLESTASRTHELKTDKSKVSKKPSKASTKPKEDKDEKRTMMKKIPKKPSKASTKPKGDKDEKRTMKKKIPKK
jgi:hypothetical protein